MNNNDPKSNKMIIGIIIGIAVALVAVFVINKFTNFMEERQIQGRIQENNMAIYNQKTNQVDENLGEPTDLPLYQGGEQTAGVQQTQQGNTWNGKTLIDIEEAKKIAIETVGGGDVIFQEEDIYDLDDNPTYDFKIKNGNKIYEVEMDALTGSVIDFDID